MSALLYALLFLVPANLAINPGLRIRITQDGLNYANSVGVDIISTTIKNTRIPDISGEGKDIKYTLTSLIIKNFRPPNSAITLASESDLQWRAVNTGLELDGKFTYKYKKGLIKLSGHGGFNLKFSDISFNVEIQVGVNTASGKPTIRTAQCSCNSGPVKIKFSGAWSWIYNLFSGIVEKKIGDIFQSKICDIIQNVINKDAEASLETMKVEVNLGRLFTLNYKLLAAPKVTSEFIEGDFKGEIFWKSDKTEAPFSPDEMATITDTQKMVYLTLSDYVFNTWTYQAHKHELLAFNLTTQNIKNNKNVLNTTCSGICIGKLIPQIGKTFPNCTVELQMKTTEAPLTQITPGAIGVSAEGNIRLYARKLDHSLHYLFTIFAEAETSVVLTMTDGVLYGKLDKSEMKTNVTDTAIGQINEKALQFLVDSAIKTTITPKINELGAQGFPLPSTDNLQFKRSDLKLLQNTILIETDLKYIPDPTRSKTTVLKFVPRSERLSV